VNTVNSCAVDAKAVVLAEFELMLTRCEAAGVPRDVARSELAFKFLYDSAMASANERRTREEAAAQTPAGQALQKAHELYFRDVELQRGGVTPDLSEFNSACEDYLRLAHSAALGDTLEIHAWAKPRTIRVQAFRLSFYNEAPPTDAMMWFEGEGVRNCPKNRSGSAHGAPLHSQIYKV
jgi:hypothetical protein